MAEIKREYKQIDYFDTFKLQEHFEEMALKGWLIFEINYIGFTYLKIEPTKLHIYITYIPSASMHSPEPSEKELEFEEFCAQDGWKLAASKGMLHVFYNKQKNPVPLETDIITQVKNIHKAIKRQIFYPNLLLSLLFIQDSYTIKNALTDNIINFLSNPLFVSNILSKLLFGFYIFYVFYHYFTWCYKAKKKAEIENEFLPFTKRKALYNTISIYALILLLLPIFQLSTNQRPLFLFCIFATLSPALLAILMSKTLKKRGMDKFANLTISFLVCIFMVGFNFLVLTAFKDKLKPVTPIQKVVGTYEIYNRTYNIYDAPLPLKLEQLTDTKGGIYSCTLDNKTSFLVSQTVYEQRPIPTQKEAFLNLWYRVVDIKHDFIYEYCKENALIASTDWSYQLLNEPAWEAKEVYQEYNNGVPHTSYLICYEKRLLFIRFPFTPTTKQIKTVVLKLKP